MTDGQFVGYVLLLLPLLVTCAGFLAADWISNRRRDRHPAGTRQGPRAL